jgi:hypothetical protein
MNHAQRFGLAFVLTLSFAACEPDVTNPSVSQPAPAATVPSEAQPTIAVPSPAPAPPTATETATATGTGTTTVDTMPPTATATSTTTATVPVNQPTTATNPACDNSIEVEYVRHFEGTVGSGTTDVQALIFRLTPGCKDVTIGQSDFHISGVGFNTADPTAFYYTDSRISESFFQNIRVATASTGQVVMGPIASPRVATSNEQAHMSFTDSLTIKAGESALLVLTMDISPYFTLARSNQLFYSIYINDIDAGGDVPMKVVYGSEFTTDPWPMFEVKK